MRNESRKFIDKWVTLRPRGASAWLPKDGTPLRLPIAHGEGRFHAPEDDLKKLADKDQIWLTYEDNPNGSIQDIAGVTNQARNVCGLMPHPERAMFDWMGGEDGRRILGAALS